jgi:hypothetical protein
MRAAWPAAGSPEASGARRFLSVTTTPPAEPQRARRDRTRTVGVVIALTMLASAVAVASREPLRGMNEEPTATRERPAEAVVAPPAEEFPVPGALPPDVFVVEPDGVAGKPAWLPWTIAAIGLGALIAAGVRLVRDLRRRRRSPRRRRGGQSPAPEATVSQLPTAGTDDDAELTRRAVEAALEPLRDPSDPRAAVIAAYADLEQVLAERELGREVPEAPREYLARLLRERGMPDGSLTTLTALFEEARFSLHPIPETAPRRALRALEDARAALRPPTTAAPEDPRA